MPSYDVPMPATHLLDDGLVPQVVTDSADERMWPPKYLAPASE